MKISICASMVFAEQMLEAKEKLESFGHTVVVSRFADEYVGKSVEEKEKLTLFHKNEKDAIKDFWKQIKASDAILVLNYERRGVKNYIGGKKLLVKCFG